MSSVIAARREMVLGTYNAAKTENKLRFLEGDVKGTKEYIFENQIVDANEIVREFYENNRRVISISKKTKVGMDGLMIEIAKLMTTHPDDDFVVNPANVRIITGMSNAGWEKDMKDKCPNCFKDKIFHHDQLKKAALNGMRDSLIIIDEIDTGDKELQVLHSTLKEAGLLDVTFMVENNIRFVFASATMIKELYALYHWGDLHKLYTMTIPANYIGHIDFLNRGIIKEFYPLDTFERADKWIKEDIIENYRDDYRLHIVRVTTETVDNVQSACIRNRITFHNHTSKKDERLSDDEIGKLFIKPLTSHIVLAIKGFFRRANLIPNQWKLRIGATHELYTKKVDNNVQCQGLPGRMTGYWREIIEAGHKTGPYRTSINAIREYEQIFANPFGNNSYSSAGFTKKTGKVTSSEPLMISAKNIVGLIPIVDDDHTEKKEDTDKDFKVFDSQEQAIDFAKTLGPNLMKRSTNNAPKELRINNSNPSVEDLLKRMWGINSKNRVRMVPTKDNTWCVYWRPSIIEG